MSATPAEFVAGLLHAATTAHLHHFKTDSFAEHMALGDLYESLTDLTDKWTEAYQGRYAKIKDYPDGYKAPKKECLDEVRDMGRMVATMRKNMPQDTELQNITDEIQAAIDTCLYKLRYLK